MAVREKRGVPVTGFSRSGRPPAPLCGGVVAMVSTSVFTWLACW
jgi:hypothetical protein